MPTLCASCLCGQLRLESEAAVTKTSLCHCLACQKRTGSAFGVQARLPQAASRVVGRASEYAFRADSGSTVTFRFCPDCGGTVFWTLPFFEGDFVGAVGCVESKDLPAPAFACYHARKLAWVTDPESVVETMD